MTKPQPCKNILLIVVDQWRGDSLSCAGHPTAPTPHLDALAADDALFRLASCAGPLSCFPPRLPACS